MCPKSLYIWKLQLLRKLVDIPLVVQPFIYALCCIVGFQSRVLNENIMLLTRGGRGKRLLERLKPFVYRVKAIDEGKVGYRRRAHNVVADTVDSLLLLLVYAEIVLVFGIELTVDSELVLVQLGY